MSIFQLNAWEHWINFKRVEAILLQKVFLPLNIRFMKVYTASIIQYSEFNLFLFQSFLYITIHCIRWAILFVRVCFHHNIQPHCYIDCITFILYFIAHLNKKRQQSKVVWICCRPIFLSSSILFTMTS